MHTKTPDTSHGDTLSKEPLMLAFRYRAFTHTTIQAILTEIVIFVMASHDQGYCSRSYCDVGYNLCNNVINQHCSVHFHVLVLIFFGKFCIMLHLVFVLLQADDAYKDTRQAVW